MGKMLCKYSKFEFGLETKLYAISPNNILEPETGFVRSPLVRYYSVLHAAICTVLILLTRVWKLCLCVVNLSFPLFCRCFSTSKTTTMIECKWQFDDDIQNCRNNALPNARVKMCGSKREDTPW